MLFIISSLLTTDIFLVHEKRPQFLKDFFINV